MKGQSCTVSLYSVHCTVFTVHWRWEKRQSKLSESHQVSKWSAFGKESEHRNIDHKLRPSAPSSANNDNNKHLPRKKTKRQLDICWLWACDRLTYSTLARTMTAPGRCNSHKRNRDTVVNSFIVDDYSDSQYSVEMVSVSLFRIKYSCFWGVFCLIYLA